MLLFQNQLKALNIGKAVKKQNKVQEPPVSQRSKTEKESEAPDTAHDGEEG